MNAERRMQPKGLAMVQLAKETGTWTALDKVEQLICPPDMVTMLEANHAAKDNWSAFPKSVKSGILEWIYTAKRSSTRQRRIQQTVEMASRNERANQYTCK